MAAFFVLQPGDWAHSDHYLCRPLLGHRQGRPAQLPWQAIATGVADGEFQLVPRAGLAAGDIAALVSEAQSHTQRQNVTWDVVESRGLIFKKPAMLRAMVTQPPGATPNPSDDLSAEQCLSATSLAAASEQLRSSHLIVITPKRGCLLAVAGRAGEFPTMMKMHQAASGIFSRAGDDRLSPYACFVKDGELEGVNVFEGSGGFMHLAQPQQSEWR